MLIYCIIVLFIIVLFLDYQCNNNELFTNNPTTNYINNLNQKNVLQYSDANSPGYNVSMSAMPASLAPPQFNNFGIIGKIMPDPVCDSCQLDFGCSNYVWDADEKNMNVCRYCNSAALNKNYNDMSRPLYLMARTTGRPRACRRAN